MARPRTFDEPQVTRQAREVFHDHGYAATSVQHLTAATGLSRSSLYGAFGDKHGVFLRAFAQYCDDNAGAIERELAGDDAGARGRLEHHLRTKVPDSDGPQRGCLLAKGTAELAGEDVDVARIAGDFYATYERALTACVRSAQAAGDVRADLDPAATGALLLSVLRGIETLGRAGHPAEALRSAVDAAMAMLAAPGR
ncbi:TetR/AcrR family transcriptional regulator [Patulibacter americanus]|uniref:TetR/AcrR family transcriptional regulator n=1 Tax=Patulibacter americanus TaxID=588672 RepID=UPI0003B60746|nr:TetR/AcrR family transcriptional regulator [Patulibacter americanus]